MDVEVRCFGDQDVDDGRLHVRGYPPPSGMTAPDELRPVFGAMGAAWPGPATNVDADVVHCHTWYSHLGGILISQGYGIPLVRDGALARAAAALEARAAAAAATTCRAGSSRRRSGMADAVIAVSQGTRADILRVTPTCGPSASTSSTTASTRSLYRHVAATDALERYGVDPSRPIVLFVGRITRQKGIVHLARAIPMIDPSAQIVLCAGAPTRPRSPPRWSKPSRTAQRSAADVIWIQEMLPREELDPVLQPRGGVLLSVDLRAVRDHQPGSDGVRHAGGRQRASAASRRSSSTVRRACSCRSSSRPTARSSRSTRTSSAPTWRPRSIGCWPTRRCASGMGARRPRARRARIRLAGDRSRRRPTSTPRLRRRIAASTPSA